MKNYIKTFYGVLMCALLLSNAAEAVVPIASCEEPTVSVIVENALRDRAQSAMINKLGNDWAVGCAAAGVLLLESAYNLWYAIPELDAEIARLAQQPVKTAADGLPYAYALSKRARLHDAAVVSLCFVSVGAVVAGVIAYTTYKSQKAEQKKREQQATISPACVTTPTSATTQAVPAIAA